jgi:hypothetical protein
MGFLAGRCSKGVCNMNSAERARWLQPSAALPVDGGEQPDPEPSESARTDDALHDVLRAMRDAVADRREPFEGDIEQGSDALSGTAGEG